MECPAIDDAVAVARPEFASHRAGQVGRVVAVSWYEPAPPRLWQGKAIPPKNPTPGWFVVLQFPDGGRSFYWAREIDRCDETPQEYDGRAWRQQQRRGKFLLSGRKPRRRGRRPG